MVRPDCPSRLGNPDSSGTLAESSLNERELAQRLCQARAIMTILNLTGLLLSFAGSFVLLFCAGQPVQVTKEGLGVITWTNSPAADEKAANKRRYWIEL